VQIASSTHVYVSTAPDGEATTITQVFTSAVSTPTNLSSQSTSPPSKGFFSNKGAVAGVFAVVGVVALIIGFVLVTNAVRRRRAKKFDAEIEEAAREAAHADTRFPDEDDDYGFSGRSMYSDRTHGTYSQQPLKPAESYTMAELPMSDPYGAAGVGSGYAGAGVGAATGMAGVGGGANLNRSRSTAQPYNAFAGPPESTYPQVAPSSDPYYNSPPMPAQQGAYPAYGQSSQVGLLEAAGLVGGAAVGAGAALNRGPSQHQPGLARNPSNAASRVVGGAGSPEHDLYAASPYSHYPPPPQSHSPPEQQGYPGAYAQPQQPQARPVSMAEDPYAGYTAHSPTRDNFAISSSPEGDSDNGHHEHNVRYAQYAEDEQDMRASVDVDDGDDYGYGGGRRVLKVANA
jgi:hypothetical protein